MTLFDLLLNFLYLVPLMLNIHAKFEVSSLNRSRVMEGSHNSKSMSHDPSLPVNGGSPVTPYLNSSIRFAYSLYSFHGATTTITGNLQVSIATVKAFLTQNFRSPVKIRSTQRIGLNRIM